MNNTELVQRKADAWNAQDRDGYLALFTEDCEVSTPSSTGRGHQGVLEFWDANKASFPDSTVKIVSVVDSGDTVAVEWLTAGTNTGPLFGPDGSERPATGRYVTLPAATIYTVRDGRIAGSRYYWDTMTMLAQLAPDAEQPAAPSAVATTTDPTVGELAADGQWHSFGRVRTTRAFGDITFQPDAFPGAELSIRLRKRGGAVFSNEVRWAADDRGRKPVATRVLAGTNFTVDARMSQPSTFSGALTFP